MSQGDGVSIAASDLDDLDCGQEVDESWRRLIWIPFDISRKILHGGEAELAACARSPRVDVSADVNRNRVSIASCNLVDTLVPELINLEWVRLK